MGLRYRCDPSDTDYLVACLFNSSKKGGLAKTYVNLHDVHIPRKYFNRYNLVYTTSAIGQPTGSS